MHGVALLTMRAGKFCASAAAPGVFAGLLQVSVRQRNAARKARSVWSNSEGPASSISLEFAHGPPESSLLTARHCKSPRLGTERAEEWLGFAEFPGRARALFVSPRGSAIRTKSHILPHKSWAPIGPDCWSSCAAKSGGPGRMHGRQNCVRWAFRTSSGAAAKFCPSPEDVSGIIREPP